jgi:biotin carboxyl carrier protein
VAAVTALAPGVYRVEHEGRQSTVYVAGPAGDLWAFCDGQVYREHDHAARHGAPQLLTAPMPATVVKVLVAAGQTVRRGDTLVLVEAMKMELPIRAPGDAVVKAVHCHEGEIVQPDRTLVELE